MLQAVHEGVLALWREGVDESDEGDDSQGDENGETGEGGDRSEALTRTLTMILNLARPRPLQSQSSSL